MRIKERLYNVTAYEPGKPIAEVQKEYGLTDVIKLASNENPFGCSPKIAKALESCLDSLAVYPDGSARTLRRAVAEHWRIKEEQLVFGNGSDELVSVIARSFLDPDSDTIMADVTFSRYKDNAQIEGANIIEVPLKEGVHDLAAMAAAVTPKTKIIWVCNPNNPTGTFVTHTEVVRLLEEVPPDVMVVLDEAYYEYHTLPDFPSAVPLLDAYPNLIILRTFSKAYGLAALRVGYGIMQPALVDILHRVREPFNVNSLAQVAALAALEDQEFVQECQNRNAEGLEMLCKEVKELGLSYYPSQANFLMIHLGRPAAPVFEALLREGVIVRSGVFLGMPQTIRVTVGSHEQNKRFIRALKKVLEG